MVNIRHVPKTEAKDIIPWLQSSSYRIHLRDLFPLLLWEQSSHMTLERVSKVSKNMGPFLITKVTKN